MNAADVHALVRRAGRPIKRRLRRRPTAPGLPPTDWSVTQANPDPPQVLDTFRFFAILGTWNESDVVGATVTNALTQGCERIYLVDNDSPDDTVACAEAAGAVLARRFATESYDETLRMRLMNEVVADVSAQVARDEGAEHIWWLWLDADEFHHGPNGLTLAAYLATLDRRFRLVGSRFFNHYPDRVPEYRSGRHPLDHQPLCEEQVYPMCTEGHRKHPLQRWDRDAAPITCLAGFHQARCENGPLIEPARPIFLHHFPYRAEATSRARLDLLCNGTGRAAPDGEESWHIYKRFRSFDAVYRHDWDEVESLDPYGTVRGIVPRPWSRQVDGADADFCRW